MLSSFPDEETTVKHRGLGFLPTVIQDPGSQLLLVESTVVTTLLSFLDADIADSQSVYLNV